MARVQRVPAFDPLDSDEEDELDALSRNGAGVPVVGHGSLQGQTQVQSRRPRRSQRSRASIIVTTQADNDTDADDERLLSEDVVSALESDLAVEVDGSVEVFANKPVPSTVPASSRPVRRRLVLVGGGRRVVLMPQSAGTPRSIQDVVEREMMQTKSLEQWSTVLT